jgi:hypothetical protein
VTRSAFLALWGIAAAAVVPFVPRGAAAQGVQVGFTPTHQVVGAGSGFDVELRVTAAGSTFNGFEARVRFDTSQVTLVPASPTSAQQGSYMTGACGTTFHQFVAGADSCDATDVLLCNGVSLTGPGQIYKLHFTAANTPNVTTILHLEQVSFYDAGVRISPVIAQDDTILIGYPVGVGDSPTGAAIELRAAPNPSAGGTTFLLASPAAGVQSLLVEDIAGHVVRSFGAGAFAAGARRVSWDGRDDGGRLAAPGVYLVRYRTPAGERATRFVRLRAAR